ncbi:unnamed protein product [Rhizoctonia solani]|uniref:Uncharacterized protein n=1 Tax=Rhizoctonia solani TaxID=456999 RepID=A0A8H2X5V6_9AGAM|nr:unnamed protein product [Rhizoctonia solani]
MPKHTEYIFKTPVGDLTYSAQLQEWANHYAVNLGWVENCVQINGTTEWRVYPTIQGHHFEQFQGKAGGTRAARQNSAQMIIKSPGTLDNAKTLKPSPPISRAR